MQTINIFPGPIRNLLKNSSACPVVRRERKPTWKVQRGVTVPIARLKLTDEDILTIRGRYEFQGERPENLACDFNVSRDYIYSVVHYWTRSKLVPVRDNFKATVDRFDPKSNFKLANPMHVDRPLK